MLADKALSNVPNFTPNKPRASNKDLDNLEAEAKRILRQKDPLPLAVNLADVHDIVQEAHVNLSLLKDLWQTARKHMV